MRDLLPALPALVLPPFSVSSAPGSLASDVPGLVSDIERRFAALENYCHDLAACRSGVDGDARPVCCALLSDDRVWFRPRTVA